jgi:hypothetical protein
MGQAWWWVVRARAAKPSAKRYVAPLRRLKLTRHELARASRVGAARSPPMTLAAKETDRWITGFA